MPIMKRATAALVAANIPDIEIVRGAYGYSARNPSYRRQRCTRVRDTVAEVIADVIGGARPVELPIGTREREEPVQARR